MTRLMSRMAKAETFPQSPVRPTVRTTTSFDGTLIRWDHYERAGAPAIVILPGFWRTRAHQSITALSRTLLQGGYQIATIDLRGHGDSGGTFGFNFHEHRDALAVIGDLMDLAAPPSFALLGLSYGGAVAISAAARCSSQPSALFLISPVASFGSIHPRINPFTIHRHVVPSQALHKPRFEVRVLSSPRLEAIDDISAVSAPAAFVHVVDDWLIHHSHSERLAESHRGEHELHLLDIPGGYHADRIFTVTPGTVETLAQQFFDQRLRR